MPARQLDRLLAGATRFLARAELSALLALMLFVIGAIAIQTVTRYAFGRPITWVEEGAVYAFIWITFLGASYGAKQGRLIKVELISHGFGERGLRSILIVSQVVTMAGCAYLAWIAPTVIAIEARSSTISLPMDVPKAWFFSVPLFYFAVVTAFVSFARLFRLAALGDMTPLVEPFPVEEHDVPLAAS